MPSTRHSRPRRPPTRTPSTCARRIRRTPPPARARWTPPSTREEAYRPSSSNWPTLSTPTTPCSSNAWRRARTTRLLPRGRRRMAGVRGTSQGSSTPTLGNGGGEHADADVRRPGRRIRRPSTAATSEVAAAEQALEQATITTPIAGQVVAVNMTDGESVSDASTQNIIVQGAGGLEATTTVGVDDVAKPPGGATRLRHAGRHVQGARGIRRHDLSGSDVLGLEQLPRHHRARRIRRCRSTTATPAPSPSSPSRALPASRSRRRRSARSATSTS